MAMAQTISDGMTNLLLGIIATAFDLGSVLLVKQTQEANHEAKLHAQLVCELHSGEHQTLVLLWYRQARIF